MLRQREKETELTADKAKGKIKICLEGEKGENKSMTFFIYFLRTKKKVRSQGIHGRKGDAAKTPTRRARYQRSFFSLDKKWTNWHCLAPVRSGPNLDPKMDKFGSKTKFGMPITNKRGSSLSGVQPFCCSECRRVATVQTQRKGKMICIPYQKVHMQQDMHYVMGLLFQEKSCSVEEKKNSQKREEK